MKKQVTIPEKTIRDLRSLLKLYLEHMPDGKHIGDQINKTGTRAVLNDVLKWCSTCTHNYIFVEKQFQQLQMEVEKQTLHLNAMATKYRLL
jgi:predicted nucleotide-binding protein (sugar kinase/HSP70/actin superfamily)